MDQEREMNEKELEGINKLGDRIDKNLKLSQELGVFDPRPD